MDVIYTSFAIISIIFILLAAAMLFIAVRLAKLVDRISNKLDKK